MKKLFTSVLISLLMGGTLFALDDDVPSMEVFPGIYTGIGISGGYVTDDMVDIVNGTYNNDSIARLVNFVIPIQLSCIFIFNDNVNSFNFVSINGDFSFDFGTPFNVGGTAGGSLDFNLGPILIGVGGGYRWAVDSIVDKNIKLKGTGFPYARISFGLLIPEFLIIFKPQLFVDFIFPDRGNNIGINVGFTVMFNILSPAYISFR